jgi:hypothetical protein
VTQFVKHQRRLWSIHQNILPPIIPNNVVIRVKLLVIEAMGVVGILPAALTEDAQRDKRHNNIKMGTIAFILQWT